MEDIKEIYAVENGIDYEGVVNIELFLSYEKAIEAYEKNNNYDDTYMTRYVNENGCFKESNDLLKYKRHLKGDE